MKTLARTPRLSALGLLALGAPAAAQEVAGWDCFTCPSQCPNTPDMPQTTNGDATLTQHSPTAIVTSSCNLYDPAGTMSFTIADLSTYDVELVELRLETDGNPLDLASVELRFGGEVRLPEVSGGMGDWDFRWELAAEAAQILEYEIVFAATAPHMSLDVAILTTSDGEGIGERYCEATPNSTGAAATIDAAGSALLADDDLNLAAQDVPAQPGLFFRGPAQQQIAFGNGFLCITGGITRGPVVSPAGGIATYRWPAATLPAGQQNFQYWFRDPAAGGAFFDTSDGVSVLLQ